MQTVNVSSWEEFEEECKKISGTGGLLYRGQSNSRWSLDTTLERAGRKDMSFDAYYKLIGDVQPQIESFTGAKWEIPSWLEIAKHTKNYLTCISLLSAGFPAVPYMAHLRHHKFPSPLLDWTRSPHVAAYFAFSRPDEKAKKVAIYVYSESPQGRKVSASSEPWIQSVGQYIRAHRRHFLQQSTYTACLMVGDRGLRFASHEKVFDRNRRDQDVLWKFKFPVEERIKILKQLDSYNLNAYSLFDSEEALMETLALREFDFK